MKWYKQGFFLLIVIAIMGSLSFAFLQNPVQARLDAKIARSEELTNEGAALFHGGSYDEAYPLFLEAVELNPLNPIVYTYLAYVYQDRQEYQEAYEHFLNSIHLGAIAKEGVADLTRLLLDAGQYDEAYKYLQQGLKGFPDDGELNFLLGQVHSLRGNYKRAKKILKGLDAGEMPGVNKYLGLSYYWEGNEEKAAKHYGKYLEDIGQKALADTADGLHEQVWGGEINAQR